MIRNLTTVVALLCCLTMVSAAPLGAGFTYQGELREGNAPANGVYDFQFELFDSLDSGSPVATAITVADVAVTDGVFSVELDFGVTPFAGDQLWLDIAVKLSASDPIGFVGLTPRQKLTATPYALHAEMVALDSIGQAEISANSVGTSEIDAGQVQRRVVGSCSGGESIRSINSDGSVVCEQDAVGDNFWTPGLTDSLEPDRSVRVQPGTAFPFVVRHASTIEDPQAAITDSADSEYARLSFYNDAQSFVDIDNPLMWTIAARITDNADDDRMNFFNRRFGDIMSLTGSGLVGINRINPLAPLDLRSRDNWIWTVGNGRGDFYLGDGLVGISMGVALNGGGRGASRIWTKGGTEELFFGSETHGDQFALRNGNIGLGNNNPAVGIDISGQIRARGLAHIDARNRPVTVEPDGDLVASAPQVQYYSIPMTAFGPNSSSATFSRNMQFYSIAGSGFQQLAAPVHLPDGATVTEVTVWFEDNDAAVDADISFSLRYYNHITDFGFGPMTFVTSSGASPDTRTLVDDSIFAAQVDNENRNYSFSISSSAWSSSFRIRSVRIAYLM